MSRHRGLILTLLVPHILFDLARTTLGLLGALMVTMPAMMTVMIYSHPEASGVIWVNIVALGMFTAPFVLAGAGLLGLLPVGFSIA